jgi:hypothetical protein
LNAGGAEQDEYKVKIGAHFCMGKMRNYDFEGNFAAFYFEFCFVSAVLF